jgi:hypothetical protein
VHSNGASYAYGVEVASLRTQDAEEAGFQLQVGEKSLGWDRACIRGVRPARGVGSVECEEKVHGIHQELSRRNSDMDRKEFQARTLLEADVELHEEKATVPDGSVQANSSNVRAVTLQEGTGRSHWGVSPEARARRNGQGKPL